MVLTLTVWEPLLPSFVIRTRDVVAIQSRQLPADSSSNGSSSITLFIHADPVNRVISTRGVFQKITLHDK